MLSYNLTMLNGLRIQNLQLSHIERVAKWQHDERERHGCAGSLDERERRLREHVREEVGFPITYVAIQHGNLIGCCSLVRYGLSVAGGAVELDNHLWLSNVYVHPDYRKCGVAAQLISYSQKQASLAGIVQLQLFTSNTAKYYRDRGWVAAGVARVGREDVEILKCALA